jgi:hypothetical protein
MIVAFATAIVLAACGPSPTNSPTAVPAGSLQLLTPGTSSLASVPPEGSPGASPGSTVTPAPAARPIQPGIAAQVLTPLNVREFPSTSARKMGALSEGDIVYLYGYGGIKANGFVWFEAGRIKGVHGQLPALPAWPIAGDSWTDLSGWIAIGTSSAPWIAALEPRCSDAAATDLATLSAMLPGEELACLGSTPLVLRGTFGCGGCGGAYPGTFTPEWLAEPLSGLFSVNFSKQVGPLQLYFAPGTTRPKDGSILRVQGHLDDSRASKCKVAIPTNDSFLATPVPVRAADAQAWCREHIVVDAYEVLGADPSYPPS